MQQAGGLAPILEQFQAQMPKQQRSSTSSRSRRRKNRKTDVNIALEESLAEFSESIGLDKYVDELLGKKKKKGMFF
ncbi:hypothetical protein MCUN1_003724 [Malassezia cuniculi]|uniref:Uncharacterized protein n=1 Tax=Malassezia cuniculi TaxID=948313 RepID=A0AAF0EX86_9BASI|nr:hypothetical protein MCUN1_003724 [Malassezia cuniculi]